jgi:hypothetical protein
VLLSLGCLISGIGIALLPHSPSFPWLIAIFTPKGSRPPPASPR